MDISLEDPRKGGRRGWVKYGLPRGVWDVGPGDSMEICYRLSQPVISVGVFSLRKTPSSVAVLGFSFCAGSPIHYLLVFIASYPFEGVSTD